jgi:hypothetical protein
VVEVRVPANSDDAEEAAGTVDLTSSDLELTTDGSKVQTVGMRFPALAVPAHAIISNAYVQFRVDEATTDAIALKIEGQASGDATTFTTSTNNVSSRPRTSASVDWSPVGWPSVGAAGSDQRTPNLAAIVQEIVNQATWASGHAVVVIITGTGHRVAVSHDGIAAGAPLLHVEYAAATTTSTSTTSSTTIPSTTTTTSVAPPTTTTTSIAPPTTTTLAKEIRVPADSDDAEEAAGRVDLSSSDLELTTDGSKVQTVGMRFPALAVPKNAVIANAWVQFQVDEATSTSTSLKIEGQASGDAGTFTTSTDNVSSRPRTSAFVNWTPANWPTVGTAGVEQRTPNLAPIVRQIVNQATWASGHALVIIITGTGHRVAVAHDGIPAGAPLLHVEYGAPPT